MHYSDLPPNLQANPDEILHGFQQMFTQGSVTELRVFTRGYGGKLTPLTGYFNDFEALAYTAAKYSDEGAIAIYHTPQGLKPGLLARAANKMAPGVKATSDGDVQHYNWLLVDIDPTRVSHISSTQIEKDLALTTLKEVYQYLQLEGFPTPVVGDSGNGWHLMYPVDIKADEKGRDLITDCLKALDFLFSSAEVKVDTSVGNPARIWKTYGTVARKGDDTSTRPWRKSKGLKFPLRAGKTTKKLLEKLAKRLPPEVQGASAGSSASQRSQLTTWIHKHFKDRLKGPISWPGKGVRWIGDCPWDQSHNANAFYIVHLNGGGIAAGCQHESCEGSRTKAKKKNSAWDKLQKLKGRFKSKTPGTATPSPPVVPTTINPGYTETGNAIRLIRDHGQNLHYVPEWGKWLFYNGVRWKAVPDVRVEKIAKNVIDSMYSEATVLAPTDSREADKLFKWALKSSSAAARRNMITLAKSEQNTSISINTLDCDLWKLNLLNGTLDLKSGTLTDHTRDDLITKLAKVEYDPEATCPRWDEFMHTIMQGDQELIDYLHCYMGYSMTGFVTEQSLAFLYGTGANGKSVFLNTMRYLMGDYAQSAPPELLLAKKFGGGHPTNIADLYGARLVTTTEIAQGRAFAEELVKSLTGGDGVKARFMYQNFFEFEPTHKLWIAANYKPIIKGTDKGIWRRMRLIPFEVSIPEDKQDKQLEFKLREEIPGIFNHLLKGCKAWQQAGLPAPPQVVQAVQEYRDDMDLLKEFLEDWCLIKAKARSSIGELYNAYLDWCETSGERRPLGKRALGRMLKERGFDQIKSGNHRYWQGIVPKPQNINRTQIFEALAGD